jgi:hypothetical protein
LSIQNPEATQQFEWVEIWVSHLTPKGSLKFFYQNIQSSDFQIAPAGYSGGTYPCDGGGIVISSFLESDTISLQIRNKVSKRTFVLGEDCWELTGGLADEDSQ